jgi:putative ABC transport system permease protein
MILSLAWKNIWRNKLRSAIVISSMVFGLMGVMMMIGFSNAMVDNMVDNAIAYEYGHLQVHNPEFIISEDRMAWLPEADLLGNKIKSVRGVAGVTVSPGNRWDGGVRRHHPGGSVSMALMETLKPR